MVRSDEQMLAASGEVERPSKTDCVAIRAQSLSAPQDRIGHAYVHGALDLLGDRQRAGVHGLRHGARCCRDLPRDRRHRRLDVSSWPDSAVAGIRLERQLSEDELPYTAIEHDGRI